MTEKERVIVSAYTGVLMCSFSELQKYVEQKLDRPVFTHEFADKDVIEEIKKRVRDDFLALCG